MQIHGPALRFGVHSGQQYTDFGTLLDLWQRAEALGYDMVSLFDHFRPPLGGPAGPCFDGLSLLSALAARTERVRCVIMVSAVTWRHPALAANIATTIDHVSGGRLEFGVGAASADLAYEQYGIPFPSPRVRVEMLDEACHVLRGLWTQPTTTFSGRHVRLADARLEPKPLQTRLPLIIGGDGERRTLRVVARHADIWNTLAGDPESYARKLAVLGQHCAATGRDPDSVRKSVTFRVVLAGDRATAQRRWTQIADHFGPGSPVLDEFVTIGTPEDCVRDLQPYLRMGVRDFVLGARPPVDWASVEMFAQRVVPALRAS
ncbi:LLM class flavin-dependent oxidoreductase [Micromonospora sp. NPDC023644]|uniref:LLM class flavin-dependent oxidoreductase n=1 Tax=Micromonospora sp. NPDC023644 TaxID=3154321 RepID=UPI0034065D4C